MRLGLIGADLNSSNKGCEALAYGFLEVLNKLAAKHDQKIKVVVIKNLPTVDWIKDGFSYERITNRVKSKFNYSNIDFELLFLFHSKRTVFFSHKMKSLDCIIDFTGGDSFTDIYGEDRFYARTRLKKSIINQGIPLILGSQTIGPFKSKKVEKYAVAVIEKSTEVFIRDQLSFDYTRKISNRTPLLTTDIAFALPYHTVKLPYTEKVRVGVNLSGLLWNGGYTGNNQFGLVCNYQEYCRKLVSSLSSNSNYEVHLILHAFKTDLKYIDNDLVVIKRINQEFPNTIVSPYFNSCVDAKSYIASMDIFTGARMHSTIGAFSANVPVIPFSYSRKFEGLFSSLEYPYVIEASKQSTDFCVQQTIRYIEEYKELKSDMIEGKKIIENRLNVFIERLDELLFLSKGGTN